MEIGTKGLLGVLGVAAAGGIAALARSKYERNHFVVEETTISSPKIHTEKTFVFLTDLHDKVFGPGNSTLLQSIKTVNPDFILIGGDTMVAKEGKAALGVTEELLKGLAAMAPVYYANGNHEQRLAVRTDIYGGLYQQFLDILKKYQIYYLSNATELLGDDLAISGLDIEKPHYRNVIPVQMTKEYVASSLGDVDPSRFQILLAHSPLFFKVYEAWGADLVLAGHFHGGTIRIPGLGGVMTPQYQFFLPYCAGTFEENGRTMIVGRGLGTHSINIRLGNKPQVVVVHLKPETIF